MIWTTINSFLTLLTTAVIIWWINAWIDIRAFAILTDSGYQIENEGWAIIQSIWPLLLSFGLTIGIVISWVFSWISRIALRADLTAEMDRLKSDTETYRKIASDAFKSSEEAQTKANAKAQSEIAVERSELATLKTKCIKEIKRTQKLMTESENKVEAMNRKKQKAMAYAQRQKAKKVKH